MKVILLKDIPRVGRKNEIKNISDGYALNFIIPRGLGIKATEVGIKKLEQIKSATNEEKKMQHELLTKSLENLSTITVTIQEKANEKGHLFEGIHKERLAKEIEKMTGIVLDPEFIDLPKPIKEVGEYIITISAEGKMGKVKVVVEPISN